MSAPGTGAGGLAESDADTALVDLAIEGMTCASCVARVEKRLGRLDGVTASVNLATEKARVRYPAGLDTATLVAEVERAGYGATVIDHRSATPSSAPDPRRLRVRLLVSAVLTVPVLLLAMIPAWQFWGWQWVSLALTTPVVLWGGWPFHRSTAMNLRHAAVTMDTLVTVGTAAAYLWSVWALVFGTAGELGMRHGFTLLAEPGSASGALYFEVAAAVTTFLLLGRVIEDRARRASGAALRSLLEAGAKVVARIGADGREERVPAEALRVGDRFIVRPGEAIAADGTVVDGAAAIDASAMTGESVPVEVSPGSAVDGGTIAHGGSIVVQATRVGEDTQLARTVALVEQAQLGKADIQRLADRISGVFVPIVIAIAAVTFVVWLTAGGGASAAITASVAVLIVACPCALGLATPTALVVGTGRAAQLGILIAGPEVLERSGRVDTVVFDKTGTLTTGRMTVTGVETAEGWNRDDVLDFAGALEARSEHPIGRAIANARPARTGGAFASGAEVTEFRAVAGFGVSGRVGGRSVAVGAADHDNALHVDAPESARALDRIRASGATAVAVRVDGETVAIVGVSDPLRDDSLRAVDRVRALGIEPVVVSGDHEATVLSVVAPLGIHRVVGGTTPVGKADAVRRMQAEGRSVAMVGDGVNDAAALAAADLGIAMGSGSDAAIEAADLTLLRSDPLAIADAIELSRATLGVIRGNLFWAFAYNVAAVPVAALGLLNPMIAGAAMAFSSVFVVLNSLRLRSFGTDGGSPSQRRTG